MIEKRKVSKEKSINKAFPHLLFTFLMFTNIERDLFKKIEKKVKRNKERK